MASISRRKRKWKSRRHMHTSHIEGLDSPLPASEAHIRLLEIKSGDRDSPVECTLSVHKLLEAPTYSAVSYVCGDSTPKKAIKINGSIREVGLNCHYALWQLRALECLCLGKRYWIDALCINQADLEEKSSQVQLMGQIFKCAFRVLGCIGSHNDDSLAFMEKIQTFPRWASDDGSDDHEPDTPYGTSFDLYRAWILSQSWNELVDLFTAAYNFAQRPYWDRLWIVQELALAQRITLVCGFDTVPWWPLPKLFVTDLADALNTYFWEHRSDPHAMTAREAFRKIQDTKIAAIVFARTSPLRNRSFRQMVVEFRSWQCTNPLDRVYGLLHLIDERQRDRRQGVRDWIIPDYTKSTYSLGLQCIDLLHRVDEDLDTFFFSELVNLAEALELTMYHPEICRIVQQRQKHYLECLALDDDDGQIQIEFEKHDALQLVARAKDGANGYIEMEATKVFPIEQVEVQDLMSNLKLDNDAIARIKAFYTAALSYAERQSSVPHLLGCLRPKLLSNGRDYPGFLCGRAQCGDYFVRFNKMVGHINGQHYMPCLIIRRFGNGGLFEIMGQAFIPDRGILNRSSDLEKRSDFRIYFSKEDFMAFATSDLPDFDILRRAKLDNLDLGGRTAFRGFRQELQIERLFTAITSSDFTSFALQIGSAIDLHAALQ